MGELRIMWGLLIVGFGLLTGAGIVVANYLNHDIGLPFTFLIAGGAIVFASAVFVAAFGAGVEYIKEELRWMFIK